MEKIYDAVVISDVHFGHPKITAGKIRYDLRDVHEDIKQAKLLIFAGDLFDKLLLLDHVQTQEALLAIGELLRIAREYSVKVRILRGTWSHDRGQLATVNTLNLTYADMMADLKYYDHVAIEYIPDMDLRLLFIPDDLPYKTSEEILDLVHETMEKSGWTYVDLVIAHGYFDHVLPKGIPKEPARTYRAKQFEGWVKGKVLVGHVHTHSVHKNVVYVGSFERLNHGEEEKKGYLTLTRLADDKWKMTFKENTEAMYFFTIYPKSNNGDIDELLLDMHDQIKKKFGENPYGHLRIAHEDTEKRMILIQCANQTYGTNLSITGLSTKKDDIQRKIISTDFDLQLSTEEFVVDESNIHEHVFLHLQTVYGTSPITAERIREILSE
jgi:DNA repair exonuclease SbcCD nuclease subunit